MVALEDEAILSRLQVCVINKGQKIRLAVTAEAVGSSLALFLDARSRLFGRAGWQTPLAEDRFLIDGTPARGPELLSPDSRVEFLRPPWEEPPLEGEIIPIFQSEDLLIVDKPAGIPVTPTGDFLENCLLHRLRDGIGPISLSPLHRLDIETSGLIAFARTVHTRRQIQSQFQQGQVGKRYLALVFGRVPKNLHQIDLPLGRDTRIYTKFVQDPQGKPALTKILAVHDWGSDSLLELEPVTGRTNQIRAHLAAVGHPIIGDKKYQADPELFFSWLAHKDIERLIPVLKLRRQALHCAELSFRVPGESTPRRFVSTRPVVSEWRSELAQMEGTRVETEPW